MSIDPALIVPVGEYAGLRISSPMPSSIIMPWGTGRIIFHQDGRLVLEGYATLDDAAQAFWEAVQRWRPLEWTVTLPWQQEGA